jgi:hypothetical protein
VFWPAPPAGHTGTFQIVEGQGSRPEGPQEAINLLAFQFAAVNGALHDRSPALYLTEQCASGTDGSVRIGQAGRECFS